MPKATLKLTEVSILLCFWRNSLTDYTKSLLIWPVSLKQFISDVKVHKDMCRLSQRRTPVQLLPNMQATISSQLLYSNVTKGASGRLGEFEY